MRFPTPFLHHAYTFSTFAYFIILPLADSQRGNSVGKAVYPWKGDTVDMEWAVSGFVPHNTKYYTLFLHTVACKGAAVFLCSTHSPPILSCYIEKFIILQKSAPCRKGLRSFHVRGNCRSPPPVLRFLKFGKEGGQAYGKGIQNPGL